ncbi:MAG: PEP-CTERM sorting domain-containing protein [Verrucomicrobia bacterium]|nr:PEP-CTERM sorting domain-containing protein [Verrucomicrobiota bacterium]
MISKNYFRVILAGLAAWLLAGSIAQATVLLGWDTQGVLDPKAASFAVDFVEEGIVVSSLVRGPGLGTTGTAAANTFFASGFNVSELSEAMLGGHWWEFGLTVDNTLSLDLSALGVNIRRSGNGPDSWQWGVSVGEGAFELIGLPMNSVTSAGNGEALATLDLSQISFLQELTDTSLTFRLYGWGGTTAAGTGSIGRLDGYDLWVSGIATPAPIPEPSTMVALMGLAVLVLTCVRKRCRV